MDPTKNRPQTNLEIRSYVDEKISEVKQNFLNMGPDSLPNVELTKQQLLNSRDKVKQFPELNVLANTFKKINNRSFPKGKSSFAKVLSKLGGLMNAKIAEIETQEDKSD